MEASIGAMQGGGSSRKQWFPSNERELALDRITQRVFDCHWDQLEKEWTKQAVIRRYDAGEIE